MGRLKKYGSDAERLKAWRAKRNHIVSSQETKSPAAKETPPMVETPLVETKSSDHAAPSPSLGLVLSRAPLVACLYCQRPTHGGDNFCNDSCYRAFNRGKPGDPFAPAVSESRRGRRWELRAKLDALAEEYGEAQRHLDTQEGQEVCTRVNNEREPLFWELWRHEKALPLEERRWTPVRVMGGV